MNAARKPNGTAKLLLSSIIAIVAVITLALTVGREVFFDASDGAALQRDVLHGASRITECETRIESMDDKLDALIINQEVMMRAQGLRPVRPTGSPGGLP
jgi:hypothetical protein